MTESALARLDRLEDALEQVATIVDHLREQALPSAQAGQEGRISGSKDVASPPLRIDPLDEADELWSVMWELVDELLAKGTECFCTLREIQTIRAQQSLHAGVDVVRGYGTADGVEIYQLTLTLAQWLISRASTIAFGSAFTESVDDLCDRVDRLRGQVGSFSPGRFTAFCTWPCPRCSRFSVLPMFGADGLETFTCDYCEWRREVERG
ncbi:MAG: hypothetical protein D3X82_16810 [Candidatus Leucobacter sulfamidivorax]|nr:hypothetical protein [Candidatus Leucobacter sulfamidivorax]